MFRKLALSAALAAFALPALAEDSATSVKLNIAGMDARAVHQAIYDAAETACRAQLADETELVKFYVRPACLNAAITDAEAKYAAMRGLASR